MRVPLLVFAAGLTFASGFAVEPAAPAVDPYAPSTYGQYAAVHGLRMYYEIHGKGKPLLILHGGLASIPVWPEAIEYFSKGYQVITPEQMGHGRTADDANLPMDYHLMAEDTVELLRQLHIEKVFVLGWSDGGVLALDLAINHPGLVTRIAVVGANYSPNKPLTAEAAAKPRPGDIPKFIREPYEKMSPNGPDHWPVLVAKIRTMWQTQPNFTREQLAAITTPTLVIAGDHDFVTPEYTVQMWRAIPGAELWIAPNGTHRLPKQKARLFNETVDAFLREEPAGAAK